MCLMIPDENHNFWTIRNSYVQELVILSINCILFIDYAHLRQ